MRFAQPGMSEHALAAHFEYLCGLSGSQRPAYVPVVASGSVLACHYDFVSRKLTLSTVLMLSYFTIHLIIRSLKTTNSCSLMLGANTSTFSITFLQETFVLIAVCSSGYASDISEYLNAL